LPATPRIGRIGRTVYGKKNRSSNMNTTKTLALVAMTALSLGVGSAMAQSSAVPQGNYTAATAPQASAPTVTRTQDTTVQYGSSDHFSSGIRNYDSSDRVEGGF
jgi:hypothetical protein